MRVWGVEEVWFRGVEAQKIPQRPKGRKGFERPPAEPKTLNRKRLLHPINPKP